MERGVMKNAILWLPTTKKEVEARGWDYLDVIIFSGDAYVDHPSFGAAVIGRVLESLGLQVAIVPQPDWRGDNRDFTKLGVPRLFFAIAPGAMDSMVNHYTANKRLRSDDAYTPDNRAGMRPDYPSIVYTKILKQLYPTTPIVLGGIEASMRRLAHYDYWQDRLRPGILADSPADLLIYGMGEKPVTELVRLLEKGVPFAKLQNIPQTAFITKNLTVIQDLLGLSYGIKNLSGLNLDNIVRLNSYEDCLKDKLKQAENFRIIEEESNSYNSKTLLQQTGDRVIVVNPPYPAPTTDELDRWYALPYTRLPHPKYKGKIIPAYEMIRHSVTIHRGCFGGCAFCTISAHQGKQISSRSKKSILREVEQITQTPDFKGYISDLGGPSANMYRMNGIQQEICRQCRKPSCIFPRICKNLNTDHSPLIELYREAAAVKGVKKIFIGSGIRYDLLLADKDQSNYLETVMLNHVSGRLKVAPEHTETHILQLMRKPPFTLFEQFRKQFEKFNNTNNLKEQLVPYFIAAHPGCTERDMSALAAKTKQMNYHLEQVQVFTPTPMTLATEMFYTGLNPYTKEKIYSARTKNEREKQHNYFFWYKPENRHEIKDLKKKSKF
ncbi:MAG: YgiQ family radical SAM protein [Tannerella sp.]|jgi:uncharacterized radical SAM protein YgiQ|nr:YgiQ family radical SAM protein [Tannerella sp.]